jgi:hypothetical protein
MAYMLDAALHRQRRYVPTGLSILQRFYAPPKGRASTPNVWENVDNDEMPEMPITNQCDAYRHNTNLSGLWRMVAARTSRVLGHRGNSGRRCSVDAFEVNKWRAQWIGTVICARRWKRRGPV